MVKYIIVRFFDIIFGDFVFIGVFEICNVFIFEQFLFVFDGYMEGFRVVFVMMIVIIGVVFFISFIIGWKKFNIVNLIGVV